MSNSITIARLEKAERDIVDLRAVVEIRKKRAMDEGDTALANTLRKQIRALSVRRRDLWDAQRKILLSPVRIRQLARDISTAAKRARKAVKNMKKVADALDAIAKALSYADRVLKLVA